MSWNVDLLVLLAVEGCEVGEDNDGQIVLYTGYKDVNGTLVKMDDDEGGA